MAGEAAPNRTVLKLTGTDRTDFLQGLITNDIARADGKLAYAALLTPQGKYLADFFLLETGDALFLDVTTALAAGLAQRLSMYRLRADVVIEDTDLIVTRGLGDAPEGAHPDPRHPALGWRAIGQDNGGPATVDWDALRVTLGVPESGIELVPNESFALETRLDALGAVDFKKGCYVGQEVTARMKHKTELRKGLTRVELSGEARPGTEITAEGKPAGILHTRSGDQALAYLRFDRAKGPMRAGDATVTWPEA